jgi:hypothetical protein
MDEYNNKNKELSENNVGEDKGETAAATSGDTPAKTNELNNGIPQHLDAVWNSSQITVSLPIFWI